MQQGQQLLDVMNAVSARLDHMSASPRRPVHSRAALDELQTFMLLDPLLADLNKEYLDARGSRLQAEKDYGRGDGMADLAAILEDSAWCALQTRYMELRGDRRMMVQVRQMMDEARCEEEKEARKEKEREALQLYEQMRMFAYMREKNQSSSASWWLLLMMLRNPLVPFRDHHASYRFNLLAA